jgi:hypothetical protein
MVVVCLFLVFAISAKAAIEVNEAETRGVLNSGTLQINLAVGNDSQKELSAFARLEILDAGDNIISRSETIERIEAGQILLPITLQNVEKDAKKMLWYRLRYEIKANGNSSAGVVSLSEILPDLFELRVTASEQIYAGMRYSVRVRAFHPTKETPISGVKISSEVNIDLETDDDNAELRLTATGETGADGYSTLEFWIPETVRFSERWSGNIKVTGVKNDLVSIANESLQTLGGRISVYFTTDKPLYQPNQKIYVRGLALRSGATESAATTVAAEKELEFSIKDEAQTVLFRRTLKTSRFGIAAIEWQIPDNAKLGTYKISVKADEDLAADETSFKVSRYDLPNFLVQPKPDKEFYLPEENTAEVDVGAMYLFGKPVASGKVKVVRESKREWNYDEQKWDVVEEETYEGETDAEGKYVARIDLSKAHTDLFEDENAQFKDLNFTAYFTDFSTNKTEQRRFDVRVSKEPINVYLIGRKDDSHNPKMPLSFYVTTFSADGKPAVCDVEIKAKYKDEQAEKIVASLKTNEFGAGKVEFSAPEREDYEDLDLKIVARDAENRTGTKTQEIDIDADEKQISVQTDKAIYRAGESVKIEIRSTEADASVFVDVSKFLSNIESSRVKLKNGRAVIKIPYNSKFKNSLTVSAYFDDEDSEIVRDSRGIIFPAVQNLNVRASSSKNVFRPNEEATIDFNVSAPDKKQSETALGVVILDKSVEERAKTDADFDGAADVFQNLGNLLPNRFDELDLKKPVSKEIQLFAEIALYRPFYNPNVFDSSYTSNAISVFGDKTRLQVQPIFLALRKQYGENFEHPTDDASMRKILSRNYIDFDAQKDPWGTPYHAEFSVQEEYDVVAVKSAGANKVFGDKDDFTVTQENFPYFSEMSVKINKAIADYHQKTGKFVRDKETLRDALSAENINLDDLKDRWNVPYEINFGGYYRYYTVTFNSRGANKKLNHIYDDFTILTSYADSFLESEQKIGGIINKYIDEKKTFPKDEAEFRQVLLDGGINFDELRDAWNHPFYLEYETSSHVSSKATLETEIKQGEKPKENIVVTPVLRKIAIVRIRTLNEDGTKANNYYNYQISSFGGVVSELPLSVEKPKVTFAKQTFTSGKSAIYGIVTDKNNAVVPNADVVLTERETMASYETKTNGEGVYTQTNLPAGIYTVKASFAGFKTSFTYEIYVQPEKLVEINVSLEVGAISETVIVTSNEVAVINASESKLTTNITQQVFDSLPRGTNFSSLLKTAPNVRPEPLSAGFQIDGASGAENRFVVDGQEVTNFRTGQLNEENSLPANQQKSTPRLRDYFPETLLWIPELLTDASGNAQIKFRLADNITTWKIYAIASDVNGKIGVTQKEIRAFQPFFVDLEPPKFLTVGDEIFLPVQVRNYTKQKQMVNVEMSKADWFDFIDAGSKQIDVNQSASQNAVFGFRAEKSVEAGKQKVTAIADTDSDAIEKNVTVRPNGQEIVRAESKLFSNSARFDIDFPLNALPETQKAELKIYPNLLSHVTESVEGLLHRPYGCGEQTISSTFPNLMILKFAKTDKKVSSISRISPDIKAQAEKFLLKGYERLLGYQTASGGFSYWGVEDVPDVALTAYAIRFLSDARGYIEVDETVISRARSWLLKQQNADGNWSRYGTQSSETSQQMNVFTAYVVRILALTGKDNKASDAQTALQKAFSYLNKNGAEIKDPYALALFGLALLDAGNLADAEKIVERLEQMTMVKGEEISWKLETGTAFYGWGFTGEIETTALVVQLLTRMAQTQKTNNALRNNLISKGTLYLLDNKDRYGVWYSTQTTINVLDAFLASLSGDTDTKSQINQNLQITLNGETLEGITISKDQIAPVTLNLTDKLNASSNHLEISNSTGTLLLSQVVSTHYIGWQDADLSSAGKPLRLGYTCDKTNAKIMEDVNCRVEVERNGWQNYGMLLAEIGVPPGADVSRESLENAKKSDPYLSRYEILPDRIILYMWARPGGVKINFKFRPRYAVNAQTPASLVYDYYNEAAKTIAAPMNFSVE